MTPKDVANHHRLLMAGIALQTVLDTYEAKLIAAVCPEYSLMDETSGQAIEAVMMMRHAVDAVMKDQRTELDKHKGHGHM